MIKTPEEIEKMRIAGKYAASVLEMIEQYVVAGISTKELDNICYRYIIENLDAIPSTLNQQGFPASICTSLNYVVCHGIPSEKKLKNGDILNIDVTVKKDGFIADTSKMFYVGNVAEYALKLCEVTKECLYKSIKIIRPGVKIGDIGYIIQSYAEANNYSVVQEYGGHGIGKEMWEEPFIAHYGKPGTGLALKPGMIFTIEPMINLGKKEIKCLSDGWTIVTKDRKLSAQLEHTILVTESSYEVLTLRSEEIGLL